jgi:hypothetical protein
MTKVSHQPLPSEGLDQFGLRLLPDAVADDSGRQGWIRFENHTSA